jgi:hypothetical protein
MGDEQTPQAPKLSDLAHDVLAFVIEFPAGEIPLLPAQVERVLKSDALREKLQSTLLEYAMEKTKKGVVFNTADSQLGVAILKGVGSVSEKELAKQIAKDLPARRVIGAFNNFTTALKQTPMGVWVDKNRGWLIVVGVVLAVGGTAALFYTRTDSDVVNFPMSQIKGKAIPLWSPGNFKLSGSVLEFQPAQRKLGLEIIGEQKWEKLDLKVNLGVVGSDPGSKQGDDHALVTSKAFTAPQMKYSLGVELKIKDGALPNPIALGLHASVEDNKFSGADFTASTKFKNVNVGVKAQTDGNAHSGWLMIGGSF